MLRSWSMTCPSSVFHHARAALADQESSDDDGSRVYTHAVSARCRRANICLSVIERALNNPFAVLTALTLCWWLVRSQRTVLRC